MDFIRKHKLESTLVLLICINVAVWHVVWTGRDAGILTVAFLNIGQGDAVYIESPDHHQILIDSGPGDAVLRELRKVMPWYDKSIDMIMITNPDKDHIAGFIPVLKRYAVGQAMEPGTKNESAVNANLHQLITDKKLEMTIARRGQVIDLGGGASLHILFPDRDATGLDSNTGSIIAKLVYGDTSVMLTGDAPFQTEDYVVDLEGADMKSTLLKEGHHGSRTSISEKFFTAVDPEYSIISAGFKNSYGHPHKETTEMLGRLQIPMLLTFEEGTIVFESDGESFMRR